ncbi:Tfp pilus assembly protein FimT/FimU [Candidatus Dependentiae bacterium]
MRHVSRSDGFSLAEIMISIALFVLLVGLIAANTRFLHKFLLRAQVDKLYNTFVYLQRCAISTGEKQLLVFNIEKQQYAYGKTICTFPKQVVFGIIKQVKGPPSCPGRVIKSSVTFKGKKVVFKTNGIIESGTVYITDRDKKYMYAISSGVAQASYLRKYVYNGKWILIR